MRQLALLAAGPLLLASCGQSAKSAMEGFCSDLSAGKWEQAMTSLGSENDVKAAMADMEKDPQSKQVLDAMMKSAKCKVVAVKDNTVTLETDTINAQAVLGGVMADAMGLAFMSAFGGPEGEKMMEQAVLAKMLEGFANPNAPRAKATVDVALEQVDGKWVPAKENPAFASALVGGIDQLGQ